MNKYEYIFLFQLNQIRLRQNGCSPSYSAELFCEQSDYEANCDWSLLPQNCYPCELLFLFYKYFYKHQVWPSSADELIGWAINTDEYQQEADDPALQDSFSKHSLHDMIHSAGFALKVSNVIHLQDSIEIIFLAAFPDKEKQLHEVSCVKHVLKLLKRLKSITVCENKLGLFVENNILFQRDMDTNTCTAQICPNALEAEQVVLNASVHSIGDKAFLNVSHIKELIAEGCSIVHSAAFYGASGLYSIVIQGDRIRLTSLPEDVRIVLEAPSVIRDQPKGAFCGCECLQVLSLPVEKLLCCRTDDFKEQKSVLLSIFEKWSSQAGFTGSLNQVALFGRCGDRVWWYTDADGTEHVFGGGPMWDFKGPQRYSLHKEADRLCIHEGVTSIGAYAFAYCDFGAVGIANSVTDIRDYAFQGGNLQYIHFPGTIRNIGTGVISSCYCNEHRIIISSDIQHIKSGAFFWHGDGPRQIILTGSLPPRDWTMWMRSDLFSTIHESGVVRYPKSWKSLFTPQFFDDLYNDTLRSDNHPDGLSLFDAKSIRLAFIKSLELCILGESSLEDSYESEYDGMFDGMEWIAYSREWNTDTH